MLLGFWSTRRRGCCPETQPPVALLHEGAAHLVKEGFMADLYTCSCGSQTWQIFDTVVRCTACGTEFATQHTPVLEFNEMVTQELEESFEP